jgi:uncharacterized membrane protein
MKTKINNLLLILVAIVPLVYTMFIYNSLPSEIPVHWNIDGEIDNYGNKNMILMLPLITIAISALFIFLPKIDPKKDNYLKFGNAYTTITWSVTLFLVLLSILIIRSTISKKLFDTSILSIGIFSLFIIIGNFLRTIKHNYFIGIRTPWTLADERVWKETHEHVGKIWFYVSLVGLALCFIVPDTYSVFMLIAFSISLSVYAIYYSYHISK